MSETTRTATGRRLAVRFSLSVVAFALLSMMNRSLNAALEEYSRTFVVPGRLIAVYVSFAVLAGFAFGLAAMLPSRIPSLHWRRALVLAVLPALVLTLNILFFTSPTVLPAWVQEIDFLFGLHTATVCAVLMGLSLSTAIAET
jgi:hypothetical protein